MYLLGLGNNRSAVNKTVESFTTNEKKISAIAKRESLIKSSIEPLRKLLKSKLEKLVTKLAEKLGYADLIDVKIDQILATNTPIETIADMADKAYRDIESSPNKYNSAEILIDTLKEILDKLKKS